MSEVEEAARVLLNAIRNNPAWRGIITRKSIGNTGAAVMAEASAEGSGMAPAAKFICRRA